MAAFSSTSLRRRRSTKFTPADACARNSRALLLASAKDMTAALPSVIGTCLPAIRVLTRYTFLGSLPSRAADTRSCIPGSAVLE